MCLLMAGAMLPIHLPGQEPNTPPTSPPVQSIQASPDQAAPEPDRPLPDISTLMHEVEAHERAVEAIEKDYIYRQDIQFDAMDSHGKIKHTTTGESDIFYIDGVMVEKTLKKDGKDLTDAEKQKEDEKIDKEVKKAQERKARAASKGKETDSNGHEILTVSRILELGSFTNERRISLDGRDTIVLDYAGDPKAKTKDPAEEIIRNLEGTIWVDEQDKALSKAKGRITKDFKIGAGLLFDIKQGTAFEAKNTKINNEIWLPAVIDAQGKMRALLFLTFDGKAHIVDSNYRKFKATATILPGMSKVEVEEPK